MGDGSGGGEVALYGGTPRNVWLTHRSHLSMCVRGVYRVLTHTLTENSTVMCGCAVL